jgi:hypothetical protein
VITTRTNEILVVLEYYEDDLLLRFVTCLFLPTISITTNKSKKFYYTTCTSNNLVVQQGLLRVVSAVLAVVVGRNVGSLL